MKDMIKGENDSERLKNAFISELQALAQQPTTTQFRMGGLAVMDTTKTCQFIALGTAIALNRDVQYPDIYGYDLTQVGRSIFIALSFYDATYFRKKPINNGISPLPQMDFITSNTKEARRRRTSRPQRAVKLFIPIRRLHGELDTTVVAFGMSIFVLIYDILTVAIGSSFLTPI